MWCKNVEDTPKDPLRFNYSAYVEEESLRKTDYLSLAHLIYSNSVILLHTILVN